jgi:hypothetical protein
MTSSPISPKSLDVFSPYTLHKHTHTHTLCARTQLHTSQERPKSQQRMFRSLITLHLALGSLNPWTSDLSPRLHGQPVRHSTLSPSVLRVT